jgi:hypothetical protein
MEEKLEKMVETAQPTLPKTENPGETWDSTIWNPAPEKQKAYLVRTFTEFIKAGINGDEVIPYAALVKRINSAFKKKGLRRDILLEARNEAFNQIVFDKFIKECEESESGIISEEAFLRSIGKTVGLPGKALYNMIEHYRSIMGYPTMFKAAQERAGLVKNNKTKPSKSKDAKLQKPIIADKMSITVIPAEDESETGIEEVSKQKAKKSRREEAERQLEAILKHRPVKDAFTREMLKKADRVNTILDVFAGKKSFYKDAARNGGLTEYSFVVTNDLNFGENHTFDWDAADVIDLFIRTKSKFDIVDLDAFSCPAYSATIRDMISLTNDILFITCGLIDRSKTSEPVVRSWGIKFEKGKSFTKQLTFEITRIANEMGREIEFLGEVRFDGTRRLAFKLK